jgi:hypothetical protein
MITFRKLEIAMASTMFLHTFLSNFSAPGVIKRAVSKRLSCKLVVDVHLKVLTSLLGIGHQEDAILKDVDITGDDLCWLQSVGLVRQRKFCPGLGNLYSTRCTNELTSTCRTGSCRNRAQEIRTSLVVHCPIATRTRALIIDRQRFGACK